MLSIIPRCFVIAIVFAASFASLACVTVSAEVYHLPMSGRSPLGLGSRELSIDNAESLKYRKEGVLVGKENVAPEIRVKDWVGTEGSISFWIQPVDWNPGSLKDPVVFIRPLNPLGGSFLLYKRPGVQNICLYTVKQSDDAGKLVFIPFADEGLKDWGKGTWHHVAFTWRANHHARLYVDGNLVGTADNKFYFPETIEGISFAGGNTKNGFGGTNTSLIRDIYVSTLALNEDQLSLFSRNFHPDSVSVAAGDSVDTSNQERTPVNIMPFSHVAKGPVLDGVIGSDEYPSETHGMVNTTTHTAYARPLSFHTASDDQYLYFATSIEYSKSYKMDIMASRHDDDNSVNLGDQFCFMVRKDVDAARKNYEYYFFSFSPNSKLYDADTHVDWEMASVNRDTSYRSRTNIKSRVDSGMWVLEVRIPRQSLGLKDKDEFLFSAGYRFDGRLFALQDHPVWFDHYQAFQKGIVTPYGVRADFGGFNRGDLSPKFLIANTSSDQVSFNIKTSTDLPQVKETAEQMNFDQQLGVEVSVESRETLAQWQDTIVVPDGESREAGESKRLTDPGFYMVKASVEVEDAGVIYQQALPFMYYDPIAVELVPIPSQDQLKANVLLYGLDLDLVENGEIQMDFVSKQGVSLLKTTHPVRDLQNQYQFSMADLTPGDYDVQIHLIDEQESVVAQANTTFKKWQLPDWLANPVAMEALSPEWVPALWEPMQVADRTVSLWGKTFEFDRNKLIASITSQGQPILASKGITLHGEVGGKVFDIPLNHPEFPLIADGRVLSVQKGESRGIAVEMNQRIEFDGMNYVTFKINSEKRVYVEKLYIDIPLADARLMVSDRLSGLVESCDYTGPLESLWIGNDAVGLAYFAENYKGWYIDSRKPRVQVIKEDGRDVVLRLLLVNDAGKLPLAFTGHFGLLPTPIKPKFDGWRDIRWRGPAWSNAPTTHVMLANHRWSAGYSLPKARNRETLEGAVQAARDLNQKVYPYITPSTISTYEMIRRDIGFFKWGAPEGSLIDMKADSRPVEEYWYFAEDWMYRPSQYNSHGNGVETTEIAYCSPATSFADYFVGSLAEILQTSDLDGFYFDLSRGRRNYDSEKGYAYKTRDGVSEGTFELMAMRDMVKRLYFVFDQTRGAGRKPYIVSHGGYVPIGSFYDVYLEGEGIKPTEPFQMSTVFLQTRIGTEGKLTAIDEDQPRSYDAIGYRVQMGSRLGVPQILLPQYGYVSKMATPEHSRELLSFTFLHNTMITPAMVDVGAILDFWNTVEIPFGMSDTEFFPFWNNGVKSDPECVRVSYLKKQEQDDFLIGVANWSDKPVTANVRLPISHFGQFTNAVNVESGDQVPIGSGEFEVSIPAHDLRVLRVQGQ